MASRTLDAEVGKSSGSCRTCAEEEPGEERRRYEGRPHAEETCAEKTLFGRWIRADTRRGIQFFIKRWSRCRPLPALYNSTTGRTYST